MGLLIFLCTFFLKHRIIENSPCSGSSATKQALSSENTVPFDFFLLKYLFTLLVALSASPLCICKLVLQGCNIDKS